MTHSCVGHELVNMCEITHTYVWHDSFICVPWLGNSLKWLIHTSTPRVTWLIHMCDMTHSYVWHDSSICVTWLIHTPDMTHSYVWPKWKKFTNVQAAKRAGMICVTRVAVSCKGQVIFVQKKKYVYIYIYITPILKWPYSQDYRVVCWISCDSRSLKIVYFNAR